MEDMLKSLRCSTAKNPAHKEQYVVGHCHGIKRKPFRRKGRFSVKFFDNNRSCVNHFLSDGC